jgi:hypothetical protein
MTFETEKTILNLIQKQTSPFTPVDDTVSKLYLRQRLKVIQPTYYKTKADKRDFNDVCDYLHKHFITKQYSIDAMVNATIRYCNINKRPPTKFMFEHDIEALLEDYAEEF